MPSNDIIISHFAEFITNEVTPTELAKNLLLAERKLAQYALCDKQLGGPHEDVASVLYLISRLGEVLQQQA